MIGRVVAMAAYVAARPSATRNWVVEGSIVDSAWPTMSVAFNS